MKRKYFVRFAHSEWVNFIRVGLKSYIKLFASVHSNENEISFRSAENIIYIWRKCHGLVLIDLISTLISLQQCEESRVAFILCWTKIIFHTSIYGVFIYATVWYRVYIHIEIGKCTSIVLDSRKYSQELDMCNVYVIFCCSSCYSSVGNYRVVASSLDNMQCVLTCAPITLLWFHVIFFAVFI